MFEQEAVEFAFFPGFGVLASMGLGWLMNRGQSGMHQRQLSSEDARHAASLAHDEKMAIMRRDEYRNYLAQERAREEAFRSRKADALASVGGAGLAGVSPEMLGGLVDAGGGAALPPPPSGSGQGLMPVTSAGMPAGGGMSIGDIMAMVASEDWGGGGGGSGALPSRATGASHLTSGPSVRPSGRTQRIGGGNVRARY